MSEQYSHRNGETEVPAVGGLYWYINDENPDSALTGMLEVKIINGNTIIWTDYPYTLGQGRWWGPVTPPWESA